MFSRTRGKKRVFGIVLVFSGEFTDSIFDKKDFHDCFHFVKFLFVGDFCDEHHFVIQYHFFLTTNFYVILSYFYYLNISCKTTIKAIRQSGKQNRKITILTEENKKH